MTEETTAVEQEVPNITAGDLAMMLNVIDAGSQRGAWRGEELASLGALRDKLSLIVKSVTPAEEVDEDDADEASQ